MNILDDLGAFRLASLTAAPSFTISILTFYSAQVECIPGTLCVFVFFNTGYMVGMWQRWSPKGNAKPCIKDPM